MTHFYLFVSVQNTFDKTGKGWLTTDANQRIKKARSPSVFLKETIHDKYDQDEKAFLKTLESHFINYEAYQYMKENNFRLKFINGQEKTILDSIGDKIGAEIGTMVGGLSKV